MVKRKDPVLEQNKVMTTVVNFLDAYNKSVPESFPRATLRALRKFQAAHSSLFRNPDQWSIEKHRKKLMDWLPSYHDV